MQTCALGNTSRVGSPILPIKSINLTPHTGILPTVFSRKNAAKIAVGRRLNPASTTPSNLFHAAIIGQRAGHDVIWKGHASGPTREIALREMIVQVEDLVMDQLERCRYVEDVLDDLSDSDQSDDDYDNEEGGQDSEEGSAGGDDGHGKKRRNGNEDSDEAGTQKKHKSDRADEGGDGATAHTTGEAEGTGSTSSRTGAQRLEGMEMTESAIDDDIGNDTALGENLTEDESASRDHTATTTLQSSTCSTGDDGEVAVPELGTRKKSWCGLW
jgi:hypothetical protein